VMGDGKIITHHLFTSSLTPFPRPYLFTRPR
jgi:hypothetical protein